MRNVEEIHKCSQYLFIRGLHVQRILNRHFTELGHRHINSKSLSNLYVIIQTNKLILIFLLSYRKDNESDGFVISGKDIGLRLKALEYWKCAESGLSDCSDSPMNNFKIVIAEALPNQGKT